MASDLASKLQLKPDDHLVLMGVPDGIRESLETQLEGVEIGDSDEPDAVLAFVSRIPKPLPAQVPSGQVGGQRPSG